MESKKVSDEYISRVNRVLDYIDLHYADELSLKDVAQVANFSPYHFHRVFKGVVGEPLYKYLQRIRVEKAAGLLNYQSHRSIADIALSCGFGSQAAFARVFKSYFGVSATQWRNGAYSRFSKNRKNISNFWEVESTSPLYIEPSTNKYSWNINMLNKKNISVEVKTLPETNVAYIRNIGEFKGKKDKWASLFAKLIRWAGARGLIQCPDTQFFTVFRDDLNVTDFSKFKTDVCISIPNGVKAEGGVDVSVIPAGKYAMASFEIDSDEFDKAWDLIFSEWLPSSGYQPDERCCFERYLNDPHQHPNSKNFVEVYIPVTPL